MSKYIKFLSFLILQINVVILIQLCEQQRLQSFGKSRGGLLGISYIIFHFEQNYEYMIIQ